MGEGGGLEDQVSHMNTHRHKRDRRGIVTTGEERQGWLKTVAYPSLQFSACSSLLASVVCVCGT